MAKTSLPELPAGPKGAGRFGAYYTHLKWDPAWDKPWRVADHPDVVVRFDDGGHRLVFWRGTSFIPCWVTENGKWYTNEFVERRGHHCPNTNGCCEPMSDKQCRFSHVRVIESTDARCVVHWRYSPIDVRYQQPFIDPETGWGDWVDEYYTVYPDATCVRKITLQTSRPDLWTEFHEGIVVNQPGTMPEENIELAALSVSNMKGESKTYVWDENGAPGMDDFWERWDANIIKINLKAGLVPFSLVPPHKEYGLLITPYSGHAPTSHFNFWNHWPVAQVASDGTLAKTPDRPSHSSLCHFGLPELSSAFWEFYEEDDQLRSKVMLTGMTSENVEELVPLAKSWLDPPELKTAAKGITSEGFDRAQKAYVLSVAKNNQSPSVECTIDAHHEQPVIHPAFVFRGWGDREPVVTVAGKRVKTGKDLRIGYHHTLDGTDMTVWLRKQAVKPLAVNVSVG